jgi:transposase
VQPFRSRTWIAALSVITDRDRGDLARTRRLGLVRFEQVVRREILRRGGQKPSVRILRRLFCALSDPAGGTAHRAGALERVQLLLANWTLIHQRIAETETRMTGVLDELDLTRLVTSIPGISPVGAAAILAQTVIAAAILRHLHAVISTGQNWDPAIATHGSRAPAGTPSTGALAHPALRELVYA